ncbi:hypothetical protein [Clostridium perfringens]|uniref:hypothetical protein n=1 Tax=Clostridium perfringens TaxID=1502 RepID=UPI002971369D|nr:hypothetical protein [Clostridium perfringens]MDM0479515.1 hypothetical protein [Clostridium perfringens]MDM0496240.1 hypothetical protein [Clostridium perfringens]
MYRFKHAQEFIGSSPIVGIIIFLWGIAYVNCLFSNCKKGGMLMVNMIQVSTNFAISYVAGGIAPVFP